MKTANSPKRGPGRPRKNPDPVAIEEAADDPKRGMPLLAQDLLARYATTIEMFPRLPDSALIPPGALAAMEGISMPTLWRQMRRGLLPRATYNGTVRRVSVGEIRKMYRARELAKGGRNGGG